MTGFVLVIEDDVTLAKNICTYLRRKGYTVESESGGHAGLAAIQSKRPDIALVDLVLPDMGGLELLHRIRSTEPQTIVIMMTGAGSVQAAVDAMKAGAHDYLAKPLVLSELKLLLDKSLDAQQRASTLSYYHDREAHQSGLTKIIGRSAAIQELKQRVSQFTAAESQLTDLEPPTVLITGETGSGKELIARAFHFEGPRRAQPFVELNCASIPAHLIEAELFGYERGAFTDAKQRKLGLVEAANGGTLFLDEIGEMDITLQAKLLTLLESRKVRRLGSIREHEVNVRIIAATNQHLETLVDQGRFRPDLYYRLRVIQVHVPPLRARDEDIRLLAEHFLRMHADRYRKSQLALGQAALDKLLTYHWPGNIREMRNTMEQAVLLCPDATEIGADQIFVNGTVNSEAPDNMASTSEFTERTPMNLQETEIKMVREALRKTDGNVTQAARLLGLSRDTLRYRLGKYDISIG
ncbi:MAG: sigma-54-dependent Fis family transcriptional regulator [Gammaproteobacteria bacterium]|nr:sigma-54-dependent Fis family transcriptional regulator [Gammaproteobacteria bacterium]